ncbi:MAG: phosphoesterase [Flavobacteriaceae bacterium]|nr:MAG: phosphoesterase [Flavobacteriaceae bacterium]
MALLLTTVLLCYSCNNSKKETYTEQDVSILWSEMAIYITQYTPANSPTYASRCFGYIGLSQYESIVNGYPTHQSIADQLNGLGDLPKPEHETSYNWLLSLNAAQASIIKKLYNQTSDENKAKIDSLEHAIQVSFSRNMTDEQIINRSIAYGRKISETIYEWAKSDGGHRAYLRNFDKNLMHPDTLGSWKPPLYAQSFSHHPLHPHWGKNRTFLKVNAALPLPDIIPYDSVKGSPYYNEFLKVYNKEQSLTQEEKEAAIWWGDDPDVSFTPPGHSYYLATFAVKKEMPSLIVCTKTYAKVGMAVADAFIECWKWKYHFFTERPNTFIPKFIDEEWVSFWPDPPFPSFPSGHGIQAASAATVLEDAFGAPFSLTDASHIGRGRDEIRDVDFVERSFNSFWEVAQETADSRFYGGIHTQQDNNVGLEEGTKIGQNINHLYWEIKN